MVSRPPEGLLASGPARLTCLSPAPACVIWTEPPTVMLPPKFRLPYRLKIEFVDPRLATMEPPMLVLVAPALTVTMLEPVTPLVPLLRRRSPVRLSPSTETLLIPRPRLSVRLLAVARLMVCVARTDVPRVMVVFRPPSKTTLVPDR